MPKYTKISILAKSSFELSYFTGSMYRGALGYALKKVTCINPSLKCEGCFALSSCLYYDFYEKNNAYHNYRLDLELGSKYIDFSIYLYEDACTKLPFVISALHKLLTEIGLGKDRVKINDFAMYVNDKSIYKNNTFSLPSNYIQEFILNEYASNIRLKFITPFRTKRENRLLRKKPDLELILRSINNRLKQLKNEKLEKLDYIPSYEEFKSEILFEELTRLSNKQQTKMQLGGILGSIEYKNLDRKSYALLKIGEIIGIGKQTVFGLGKIQVEELYE